jgi:hypothetical protein
MMPIEYAVWGGFVFGAVMFVVGWLFGVKMSLDSADRVLKKSPGLRGDQYPGY